MQFIALLFRSLTW